MKVGGGSTSGLASGDLRRAEEAGRRASGLAQPQAWHSASPEWLTSYAAWGQGLFSSLGFSAPVCTSLEGADWKGMHAEGLAILEFGASGV